MEESRRASRGTGYPSEGTRENSGGTVCERDRARLRTRDTFPRKVLSPTRRAQSKQKRKQRPPIPPPPAPSWCAPARKSRLRVLDIDRVAIEALMEEKRPLRFSSKLSDELENINLTPAQGYILSRIDGSSCAREIVSLTPGPETEAAETLLDLISKDLVTWDDEAGETTRDKKFLSASTSMDDGESALEAVLVTEVNRILRLARERRYSGASRHRHLHANGGRQELLPRARPAVSSGCAVRRHHTRRSKKADQGVCGGDGSSYGSFSQESLRPAAASRRAGSRECDRETAPEGVRGRAFRVRTRGVRHHRLLGSDPVVTASRSRLDDTNAAYHHLLGIGLMRNQNWMKEAEESLRKATELDEHPSRILRRARRPPIFVRGWRNARRR